MWSGGNDKTPAFPGAGGDSNNNEDIGVGVGDAAGATGELLTPPYQIPKFPIRTTRPPSVSRHPDGYYITSFDLRSFIDAPPARASLAPSLSCRHPPPSSRRCLRPTAPASSGAGDNSAGSARKFFKRGSRHPAAAPSETFPPGLLIPSVPKVRKS